MALEPTTQWSGNPNFGVGEITYDDPSTTYDSSSVFYDGAVAANLIANPSQPTSWSDSESNTPKDTAWSNATSSDSGVAWTGNP